MSALHPPAVFFDLDNTLIHRADSLARYAGRFFADFTGDAVDTPDLVALTDCIVRTDCGGYLPANSIHKSIKAAVAHAVSAMPAWRGLAVERIHEHWVAHLSPSSIEMPGASALINALAARGVHVGVVSNGAEWSRVRSLQALPFAARVAQLISSESVGLRKPDPQIFRLAAERAGCAVEACWFVGDHPHNDVEGARAAGMSAIWLRGFHDWPASLATPEFAVDALAEVWTLLPFDTLAAVS